MQVASTENKKQDSLQAEVGSLKLQLQHKDDEISQLKHDLHLAMAAVSSTLKLFQSSTVLLERHTETYGRECWFSQAISVIAVAVILFVSWIKKSTCISNNFPPFYSPPHNSGRVLWFHIGCPCLCLSVRFSFPDDNLRHFHNDNFNT